MLQSPDFQRHCRNINGVNVPVFIIGDSAFQLSEYLMKPFPFSISSPEKEKLYNYRLSKVRRVVENAFGHLKARFRRIGRGIENNLKNAKNIIKCCTVLHNFVNEHNDPINQKWLEEIEINRNDIPQIPRNGSYGKAGEIRNALADFFLENGNKYVF